MSLGAGIVVSDRRLTLAVYRGAGELGVVARARQRLPQGVVEAGHPRDVQVLASALAGLAMPFGLADIPVRLGVFPSGAAIRTLDVSELGPGEEASLIESLWDTSIFWYRHWPHPAPHSSKIRVVACPRAALIALLEAAASAGLRRVELELLPDAFLRALSHQGAGSGWLAHHGRPRGTDLVAQWADGYVVHADPPASPRRRRAVLRQRVASASGLVETPVVALLGQIQPGSGSVGAAELAAQGLALAAAGRSGMDTLLVDPGPDLGEKVRPAAGSRWAVHAIGSTAALPGLVSDPVSVRGLRRSLRLRRQAGQRRRVLAPRLAATAVAGAAVLLLAPAPPSPPPQPSVAPRPAPLIVSLSPTRLAEVSPSTSPSVSVADSPSPEPRVAASSRGVVPDTRKTSATPAPPTPGLAVVSSCHQGSLPQLSYTVTAQGYFSGFTAVPFSAACRGKKANVRVLMRSGSVGATSGDTVKYDLYVSIGGFDWARLRPADIKTIEVTLV